MTRGAVLEGLELGHRLDSGAKHAEYLVSGRSGRPIRVTESAFVLLKAVQSGLTWGEIAQGMAGSQTVPPTTTAVRSAFERLVHKIDRIEQDSGNAQLNSGFWLRWPFLPKAWVNRWVAPLVPLFGHLPALLLLLFICLTIASAWSIGLGLALDVRWFWPAYVLFMISLIAHELGHAAACQRFGAAPAEIGFTIYWVFPAFYSDVTAAWRLKRRQRVIVDLAGIYFQLIVGSTYWLLYLLTGWQALEVAFLMILTSCIFNLNPIFKFDGYWVLADALGVRDLSLQPARLVRRILARLRSRQAPASEWSRWTTFFLACYTPVAIGFWIHFIHRLAPTAWHCALRYPTTLANIGSALAVPSMPSSEQVSTLLVSTFLMLVSGLMLRQLGLRLWRALNPHIQLRFQNREPPVARGRAPRKTPGSESTPTSCQIRGASGKV